LHGSRGLASDAGSQGRGSPISSKPAVEGAESIIAVASGKGVAGKSTTAGKKKKWGLSVLVLLLPCAATFGLGTWQLYRRNKKIELLDYRRKRLEEEPVLLETVLATSKGSGENFQSVDLLEYRRVVIQGKYDDSKSLFVGPRVQTLYGEAKKGYQMVTPFICQSQITEAFQC
jgi:surfeit locus 1 family protein